MKILSVEFMENWSWGFIFNEFCKHSKDKHTIVRHFMDKHRNIPEHINADTQLIQNVTLLNRVKEKAKSICRLGGNRSFEDDGRNIDLYIRNMAKCGAIIATNNKLYEIAKEANPNSYLIPNGLNLDEWVPDPNKKPRKNFVVGFCGNISLHRYRKYKGFDCVFEAVKSSGCHLKTALYKDKQIPHERMMQDFYYQIDVLIHPTLGEGSSNTLMEACACGIPIITTRCAGYHGEMMKDEIDVLFCERTPKSVYSKLQIIKNNPELQKTLSENSRKFAEDHHDVRKIVLQYEEVFQKCYERSKRKG